MRYVRPIVLIILIIFTVIAFQLPNTSTSEVDVFFGSYRIYDEGDNPILGYSSSGKELTDLDRDAVVDNFFDKVGFPQVTYSSSGETLAVYHGGDWYFYETNDYELINDISQGDLPYYDHIVFQDDSFELFTLLHGDEDPEDTYQLNITTYSYDTLEPTSEIIELTNLTSNLILADVSPDGTKLIVSNDFDSWFLQLDQSELFKIDFRISYAPDIIWSPNADKFILNDDLFYSDDAIMGYSTISNSSFLVPLAERFHRTVVHSFYDNNNIIISYERTSNALYPANHRRVEAISVEDESTLWSIRLSDDTRDLGVSDQIYYTTANTVNQIDQTPAEYHRLFQISQILWGLLYLVFLGIIGSYVIENNNNNWQKMKAKRVSDPKQKDEEFNELQHEYRLYVVLSLIQVANFFFIGVIVLDILNSFFSGTGIFWIFITIVIQLLGFSYLLYRMQKEYAESSKIGIYAGLAMLVVMTVVLILLSSLSLFEESLQFGEYEESEPVVLILLVYGFALFGFIFAIRNYIIKDIHQEQAVERLDVSTLSIILLAFGTLIIITLLEVIGQTNLEDEFSGLRYLMALGLVFTVNYWIVGVEGQTMNKESMYYLHTIIPLYGIVYLVTVLISATLFFFEMIIILFGLYIYYLSKLRQYWYEAQI